MRENISRSLRERFLERCFREFSFCWLFESVSRQMIFPSFSLVLAITLYVRTELVWNNVLCKRQMSERVTLDKKLTRLTSLYSSRYLANLTCPYHSRSSKVDLYAVTRFGYSSVYARIRSGLRILQQCSLRRDVNDSKRSIAQYNKFVYERILTENFVFLHPWTVRSYFSFLLFSEDDRSRTSHLGEKKRTILHRVLWNTLISLSFISMTHLLYLPQMVEINVT